jgi:hypothetical protein
MARMARMKIYWVEAQAMQDTSSWMSLILPGRGPRRDDC